MTGNDDAEIEARKKKYTRGWIVEPPVPYPDYSPRQEIERWCAVIGSRPAGPRSGLPPALPGGLP